jgi:peroxiredoxin
MTTIHLWIGHLQRLAIIVATTAAFGAACRADSSAAAQVPAPRQVSATEKTAQPPKMGQTAPDFELKDLKGENIKLSLLSQKGPVVLVVLRGFPGYQCPLCTVQVGQLIGKAEPLAKANARVLLVYPGPSDGLKARADEFVRGKDIPANFYLVLDPDFQFTNQYGLRWNAAGETSYPSTFVLDSERKVLFAKVSRSHGDRAKVDDVLAALPRR